MKQFEVGKEYRVVDASLSGRCDVKPGDVLKCRRVSELGDLFSTSCTYQGFGPDQQGWGVASQKDLNDGLIVEVLE